MRSDLQILGIIPARAGSKGIPHKNVKSLYGRPLLSWTIEAAVDSNCLDRVIVSTDSDEIAQIARRIGAEVPFIRPAALATDSASSIDVILHAVDWFRDRNTVYDTVVLLQPTSPLRSAEDIRGALALYEARNARAVVSVCEVDHPPFWMNTLPEDLSMAGFLDPKLSRKNRYDFPVYYRLNGALFIADVAYVRDHGFFGSGTVAFVMPKERSVDIDDEVDFRIAEVLLSESLPPRKT